MKKRSKLVIFHLILTFLIIPACNNSKNVTFMQNGNYSSGSYWEYELSTEDVIKEVDYHTSRFFLNLGPGYRQNWTFEVVGEGEVTIHWLAYVSGGDYKESESYSVTYIFDSEGNYTIKSDESD